MLFFLKRLIERNDDAYIRAKFGDNIPTVSELAKKVSLLFVNSHFAYHGSRPLPPQVVEIGGVHIKPLQPIPQVRRVLCIWYVCYQLIFDFSTESFEYFGQCGTRRYYH